MFILCLTQFHFVILPICICWPRGTAAVARAGRCGASGEVPIAGTAAAWPGPAITITITTITITIITIITITITTVTTTTTTTITNITTTTTTTIKADHPKPTAEALSGVYAY